MNIESAQDLFEKEIFERYGPSAVNISRKEGGYLDDFTNYVFQGYLEELTDLNRSFFDHYGERLTKQE